MAETAVTLVIDKLVLLLIQESELLRGVDREVEGIRDELESIQSFLKDADKRAERGDINNGLKTWVKQVREAAYHIEDVIDEYLLHVAKHRRKRGFISFLHKSTRLIKKLITNHEIASEIQHIKASVREINERSTRYGFNSSGQGSSGGNLKGAAWHDPRVSSIFIEECEVVGIETPKEELISLLINGTTKRTVVSVVGMGGLGKTTVAKRVYESKKVRGFFDCHAWITVSHSYKTDELLRSMIKQFYRAGKDSGCRGIDTMEEILLIAKSREVLEKKRYVIVFDDVWTNELWRYIKYALPNNTKGSRIVITTRINDVAISSIESLHDHVYKLQPLPAEKAWKLFCRKTFQLSPDLECPTELEKLSLEIVGRCEGLPLAIVAMGSLLSTKSRDVSRWKKLLDSLGSELESNPGLTSITEILLLSYYDLPYYLKSCFLYLSIYPRNYSISCARLIRQWIAEGFVKTKRGKTVEQVAEEYLNELIQRSLVEACRVDFDGKVRRCRVHNLMHEIILSKTEELSFCQTLAEKNVSFTGRTRRLSIHNCTEYVPKNIENSWVRSVFLFNVNSLPKSFVSKIFVNYRLLKILDFEDAPLDFLPEEVGNLFHLSYLSLRNTEVEKLPKSIGKLHNLETMNLKDSLVFELPTEIKELRNLRHLLAYYFDDETHFSFDSLLGVKYLEALQKLYFVGANHGSGLIEELGKLSQLRKLGITEVRRENGRALCSSLAKMTNLESLDISSTSEDEIIDLQSLLSPPQFLRCLYLKGRLEKLPDWISNLQNLVKIRLSWSGLVDDPLRVLQTLSNLLELGIYHAYDGEQLHFLAGSFQALKVLSLRYLNELNALTIDNAALPNLAKMDIGPCLQLKEVPSGIHNLKSLESLQFYDMPREFVLSMDPADGQHFRIVEHIPNVLFHYVLGSGQFNTYTLR